MHIAIRIALSLELGRDPRFFLGVRNLLPGRDYSHFHVHVPPKFLKCNDLPYRVLSFIPAVFISTWEMRIPVFETGAIWLGK